MNRVEELKRMIDDANNETEEYRKEINQCREAMIRINERRDALRDELIDLQLYGEKAPS